MSGYRVMAGVGKLDRGTDGKPDEIPVPVYVNGATKGSTACCLTQLTNRIGAGVTMSLSRTRNNNYIQEMGLREFTTATSGMYEVDFSFDGIFSPALCEKWLGYAFMMGDENEVDVIEVTATNKLVAYTDAACTQQYSGTDNDATVYVKCNSKIFGQPMLYKDMVSYNTFATGSAVVKLFGYKNLTGPKYFDLGYQKINIHASGVDYRMNRGQSDEKRLYDGFNEMGVLVGCIIDSASMSYESGSDAGVRFSISGHALRDIEMITSAQFDYASILDPVPTEVFVGGCVSVYDEDSDGYVPVAQTDSAAISIANNTQKLGNCLKLNYSSYAMGALTYDVSTSTYSNNPNKYLKYFYGYEEDMTPSGGETIGSTSGHYFIGKAPVPIGHMKIRTDDTSAIVENATMFMDINMTDVFVGDMSNSYSVDSAIMDEPSMRTKKVYIAVGYAGETSEQARSKVSLINSNEEPIGSFQITTTAGENYITADMLEPWAVLTTVDGEIVKAYPTLYTVAAGGGRGEVFDYLTTPVTEDITFILVMRPQSNIEEH